MSVYTLPMDAVLPINVRFGVKRGNKYFNMVQDLIEYWNIGEGVVVPFDDPTEKGMQNQRRCLVFWCNKWGKENGAEYVYANLEDGIAIRRVK